MAANLSWSHCVKIVMEIILWCCYNMVQCTRIQHRKGPMPHTHEWAMGYLLWIFWKKNWLRQHRMAQYCFLLTRHSKITQPWESVNHDFVGSNNHPCQAGMMYARIQSCVTNYHYKSMIGLWSPFCLFTVMDTVKFKYMLNCYTPHFNEVKCRADWFHFVHLPIPSVHRSVDRIMFALCFPQYKLDLFDIHASYQPTPEGVVLLLHVDFFLI